jgi:hypothetical protein
VRAPRSIIELARTRAKAARMNEMHQVVTNALPGGRHHEHRDTESIVERAWQNETTEMHIGFRVSGS